MEKGAPPNLVLSYDSPRRRDTLTPASHTATFRVAAACWLLPLVAGVLIYIASECVRATAPPGTVFVTQHGGASPVNYFFFVLSTAGVITIAIGTCLAVIGGVQMLIFIANRWSDAADPWKEVVKPVALIVGLLVSNFAVAWVFAALALR